MKLGIKNVDNVDNLVYKFILLDFELFTMWIFCERIKK